MSTDINSGDRPLAKAGGGFIFGINNIESVSRGRLLSGGNRKECICAQEYVPPITRSVKQPF